MPCLPPRIIRWAESHRVILSKDCCRDWGIRLLASTIYYLCLPSAWLVFYFGQRLFATVAFLGGAITGTVVHLQNATLPFADAWVAMSLIVLGILLLRKQEFLKRKAALVLFALCGIVHGYAYGEAVIGAEPTPLFAYLAGFTLVQLAITFCGYLAARYLSRAQPAFHTLKATGGSLALVGAGFLAVSLITQG